MNKQHYITTFDIPNISRFAVGFDRMFDELQRTATSLNSNNYPPYNILRKSETEYYIELAVAGFAEDELEVETQNGELHIRGESLVEDSNNIYIHHGIAARNFVRTFALADNVEVKSATVKNGILTVQLQVVVPEHEKPKKIAITFQK
jgi:molecular chaperone IbpA